MAGSFSSRKDAKARRGLDKEQPVRWPDHRAKWDWPRDPEVLYNDLMETQKAVGFAPLRLCEN